MTSLCSACKELNTMTPYMGLEFGKYVCKKCGFVGMKLEKEDPIEDTRNRPKAESIEDKNRSAFDKLAHRYDNIPIISQWARRVQKNVVRSMNLKPSTTVLDIGCGTGELLTKIALQVKKVVGVDVSQKMLDQAREKTAQYSNVELHEGSVLSLPFERNTFDYVVATEMFHHVEKPVTALKEMRRVVKHNGFVIIADVCVPPVALMNLMFKIEPGFVRMYSKKEFFTMFKKADVRVVIQKRLGLFTMMTKGRK